MDEAGVAWGSSVCIRVAIDVTKPLDLCGCRGHLSHQCEIQFQEDFSDPREHTPSGPWLRVMLPAQSRNSMAASQGGSSSSFSFHMLFCSPSSLQSYFALVPPPRRGSSIFDIFEPIPPTTENPTSPATHSRLEIHQQPSSPRPKVQDLNESPTISPHCVPPTSPVLSRFHSPPHNQNMHNPSSLRPRSTSSFAHVSLPRLTHRSPVPLLLAVL
ncbi:UNVERIFIED_CONTAM: hypothetical protein Sangu_3201400 [Sesamum angustifolium]|uniref:Uncharacterized protein n=1 Tax=Sesamum angustifolium TaxID=2727405 RepID=A0AAW2JLC1_9LAMI